jgi:SAM-dependent methyltransferase
VTAIPPDRGVAEAGGPSRTTAHPGALAFDAAVDVYEEARPEYPAEAVAWLVERLGLRQGRTVLDLGAGTGKLTRRLVPTGARVLAVEPLPAMRARLEQIVPEAEALEGAAEEIPLADGSVDAITVGQAFHWFRLDEALPELHRVLRPDGALALAWNFWQGSLEDRLAGIVRPLRGDTPTHRDSRWRERLDASPLFGPSEARRFHWEEALEPERVVKRVLSISFVAALPSSRLADVAQQVLAAVPDPVTVEVVTEVFICSRHTVTE